MDRVKRIPHLMRDSCVHEL
jgi:hypothetical protein